VIGSDLDAKLPGTDIHADDADVTFEPVDHARAGSPIGDAI
jgi:hypothetical protein